MIGCDGLLIKSSLTTKNKKAPKGAFFVFGGERGSLRHVLSRLNRLYT